MGSTTSDGAGRPAAYIVAAGDNPDAIADRFGGLNLWALNCARRTDLRLFAGDVVNLDKYTVATVGDEDGRTNPASESERVSCLVQSAIPQAQLPR
ncbi:hypothetical protein [Galbitalea soli]|uniref:LysM peptidoglycan-binding domain-containing protein n=1 Tax=Galbitalea soli TaxID=1268042 RepID=A0A7C9PME2_9MICO|nr:hypothetical protein [Galbitalea soli]NEM90893.1 hypothetical protein [Galbitalea soli]NYJ31615.1 hypothetical protein [Galbitalea soli]